MAYKFDQLYDSGDGVELSNITQLPINVKSLLDFPLGVEDGYHFYLAEDIVENNEVLYEKGIYKAIVTGQPPETEWQYKTGHMLPDPAIVPLEIDDLFYMTSGNVGFYKYSGFVWEGMLAGATNMEYDGRYLWIACTNGIAIYEWWGASSDNEPVWNTLDDLTYKRYEMPGSKKLRMVTFITVEADELKRSTALESIKEAGSIAYPNAWAKSTVRAGTTLNPYWIKKCAGKMYVSSGANFSTLFEFDIQTQNLIREIAIPAATMSNLGVSGAKLWYVGSSFTDTTIQKLYSFDPQTGITTFADIQARPSRVRAWIASGYNGFVYVTNHNNVSISKFNDADGTFVKTIRVNAEPTHIFSGPDRRIWVSSFGGMLSLVDFDDDGVHNDFSSGIGNSNRAISLAVDPVNGSKIWFVNSDNLLVRQDLNTHEQLELAPTEEAEEDWQIWHSKMKTANMLYVTQHLSYQDNSLTNRTVKPYMFFIQDAKLFAMRMENYLYQDVYATVNGQAAVVMGPQEYFGD